MAPKFVFAAAACVGVASGMALGITTPTEMKPPRESEWRKQARAINAAPPLFGQTSMPEDLSPSVGYGNPAYYHAYYVEAPVRTAYLGRDERAYVADRRVDPVAVTPEVPGEGAATIAELNDLNTRWAGNAVSASAPVDPAPVELAEADQSAVSTAALTSSAR